MLNRITLRPDLCNGKPTIRGYRITVRTILEYLAAGDTIDAILEAYPFLEREDILACLAYGAKAVDHNPRTYKLVS
jgi:uncharacterized protein (DUF433 family)